MLASPSTNYSNLHWYELIEFQICIFSYCDYKFSEGFWRYSKDVPSYLKIQPSDLVLTCLNNFEASKNVGKTGIVQVGSGEFSVISHTDSATRYRVSFRNDENMSYCICSSWKKSYYPCKHFFAAFMKFPNWSWDALSPLYVNSPYLQLDIYQREKNVLLLKIYHMIHPMLKILKKTGIILMKHCKEKKSKRVEKKTEVIIWLVCHQQSLGSYHYHHNVVACSTR